MPDITTFLRDKAQIAQSVRVPVGPADDPFFVHTRGISDAYRDGIASLRLAAARRINAGGQVGAGLISPDTLPPTIDDVCQARALIEHCLTGVEGLQENGEEMTFERFCDLLPSSPALISLCIGAAAGVGANRDDERKAAAGN